MKQKVTLLILGLLISSITIQSQTWTQIGQDIDGEAYGDKSGWSVYLNSNGSIVAIGAIMNDGNGPETGHVRIFQNFEGTWVQLGNDIDGVNIDDRSGCSISLNSDGDMIAIGSIAIYGTGRVRIYQYSDGTWTQLGNLIYGVSDGDRFGRSVSMSADGTIVAIGAYSHDLDGYIYNCGLVRVYEFINQAWTQIGEDIEGDGENNLFGWSVNLSSDGSLVSVGEPQNSDNGEYSGLVKVFQNDSGNWIQIGDDIKGEVGGMKFGHSVCLNDNGSIIAISAHGYDWGRGIVRIFENINGVWTQIGEDILGEAVEDKFGCSISLNSDGTIIVIGACENDENGENSGHVRIFKNNNGIWSQIGGDIDGEAAGDNSGHSVSVSDNGAIISIGAIYNEVNSSWSGHVRIYSSPLLEIYNVFSNNVSIYPNPTNGILNIEFINNNIEKILIFDITGKKLIEKNAINKSEMIDLSCFENGIYIISIQTDKEIFTEKIIKR